MKPDESPQTQAKEMVEKLAKAIYFEPCFNSKFWTSETKLRTALELIEKEFNLVSLLEDKVKLDYAILYPRKFSHLMETRAHGGFPEQELEQGRQALTSAMQKEKRL